MKCYLAATFAEQKRIREMKERLIQLGHSVTATWLEEQLRPEGMTEAQFEKKMAIKDLQEIAAADCLILDVANPSKTAGKMVEFGFALSKHKLVYVVGTPPAHSIFLSLADGHFGTWEQLFNHLVMHSGGITGIQEDMVKYSKSQQFEPNVPIPSSPASIQKLVQQKVAQKRLDVPF